MLNIKITVEIEDCDEYDQEEVLEFANNLSEYLHNSYMKKSFYHINVGLDWFEGFIQLPDSRRKSYHSDLFYELIPDWAEDMGIATAFMIEKIGQRKIHQKNAERIQMWPTSRM